MKALKTLTWITLILLTTVLIGCGGDGAGYETEAPAEETDTPPTPPPPAAVPASLSVDLTPRAGTEIAGTVTFTEADGGVAITATVSGLTAGSKHGFHLHETGDCSAEDFTSAGGHYNPAGVDHAGPDAEAHHSGDLGNLEVGEDGTANYEATSSMLTLDELNGLAVIVHEGEDDLTSQPTGAAGSRLACAVLGGGATEGDDAAEDEAAEGDTMEGEATE